jgi:hypothetical protein
MKKNKWRPLRFISVCADLVIMFLNQFFPEIYLLKSNLFSEQ